MIKKLYSFLCKFAITIWWPTWSNFRWRNAIKYNLALKTDDRINSLSDISIILKRVYYIFKYTKDPLNQLWDSIVPPPQNYLNYVNNNLADDCDGFHSAVYHILAGNNIICYLMTANSINSGHCVLIFCYLNNWYIVDYTSIYGPYETVNLAVEKYNSVYIRKYNSKPVLYNGFIEYDYKDGKFKSISLLA